MCAENEMDNVRNSAALSSSAERGTLVVSQPILRAMNVVAGVSRKTADQDG